MNPSIEQLETWILHHGFDLTRTADSVRIIVYATGPNRTPEDIIASSITHHATGTRDPRRLLELGCNHIADQLCILAPAVALGLNHITKT